MFAQGALVQSSSFVQIIEAASLSTTRLPVVVSYADKRMGLFHIVEMFTTILTTSVEVNV